MARRELRRVERIDFESQNWLDLVCDRCGKAFTMYFNGGELEYHECCGLGYELTHERIDLVVSEFVREPPARA